MACFSDNFQIFASDLFSAYPHTSVSRLQDLNDDGKQDVVLKLKNSANQIQGISFYVFSNGSYPATSQIVASDVFAAFPAVFVAIQDFNGDGKCDVFLDCRDSPGNVIRKLLFYPFSDGQYSNTPQIIASDLLAIYSKTSNHYTVQNTGGSTSMLLMLEDATNKKIGLAIYAVSDGFFAVLPTIIGIDLYIQYPHTQIRSIQDLNNDGYQDFLLDLYNSSDKQVGIAICMSSNGFFSDISNVIATDLYAAYPNIDVRLLDLDQNGNQNIFLTLKNSDNQPKDFAIYNLSDGLYINVHQTLLSDIRSDYPHFSIISSPYSGSSNAITVQLVNASFQTVGYAFYTFSDGLYTSQTISETSRLLHGPDDINQHFFFDVGTGVHVYMSSDGLYPNIPQTIGQNLLELYPDLYFSVQSVDGEDSLAVIGNLLDSDLNPIGYSIYHPANGIYSDVIQLVNSDLFPSYPDTVINKIMHIGNQMIAVIELHNSATSSYPLGLVIAYMSSNYFYSDSQQIIGSDLITQYPTSVFSVCDINSDNIQEIIMSLKNGGNTKGFAIYDFSDGHYLSSPRIIGLDLVLSHPSSYFVPDDMINSNDIILVLGETSTTTKELVYYNFHANSVQIIGSDLYALYPNTSFQFKNIQHPKDIVLTLKDNSSNLQGFAIYMFSDNAYSIAPQMLGHQLVTAYPHTSFDALGDHNVLLELKNSSDALKGFALFPNGCFPLPSDTALPENQTSTQGVLNAKFLGSLLDFSLTLPAGLSAALPLISDVHVLFSDLCVYGQTQPDNKFLAGLVINDHSDLFCSDAVIIRQPKIVVVSCSDNVLHLDDNGAQFTFSITNFMSNNIVLQYHDALCNISDTMSLLGGGFAFDVSKNSSFVWIDPCASDSLNTFITAFEHPLLEIDAQGHIEEVGSIGSHAAQNLTSDLLYASHLKAAATKLGNYLSERYSDYGHLVSDRSHLLYQGPLKANFVMADLDACQLLFENIVVTFSDISIC